MDLEEEGSGLREDDGSAVAAFMAGTATELPAALCCARQERGAVPVEGEVQGVALAGPCACCRL